METQIKIEIKKKIKCAQIRIKIQIWIRIRIRICFCRLLFLEICLLIGKSVARFLCSVAHLTPERHTGLVSPAPLCGGRLGAAIKHYPVISNMLIDTKNFKTARGQQHSTKLAFKNWTFARFSVHIPSQNPNRDGSQPSCNPKRTVRYGVTGQRGESRKSEMQKKIKKKQ